jgi:basic membrane protein A
MVHEAGIAENIFKPIYTDNISKEIQDKVAAGMEKASKGEIDFASMFANK